jgi:hypothetical protein
LPDNKKNEAKDSAANVDPMETTVDTIVTTHAAEATETAADQAEKEAALERQGDDDDDGDPDDDDEADQEEGGDQEVTTFDGQVVLDAEGNVPQGDAPPEFSAFTEIGEDGLPVAGISQAQEELMKQSAPIGKIGEPDPHRVVNRTNGEERRVNVFAWREEEDDEKNKDWFLADKGEPVAEDYVRPEVFSDEVAAEQ